MAADQRKKRLNGAGVAARSSLEQYRMKKRKLELPQNGLNSKSHISLEWDGNQKKVVAKKEQIGISRRNLRPFIDSVSDSSNVLADVFSIPQETFQLEDLTEVLSYEVWQTQLSEDERNFLMRYLPSGQNMEQVVQSLLDGDNFHFGNPLLKWGESLCSGNLHPDAVRCQERCLKADKKAYYSELQKYHNDIIEYLLRLKERWETCKDPENENFQKIWRSRRGAEKRISSNATESRLCDPEQDVTATSESCSWVADEKACSSDNQHSSLMKGGELKKRMYEKGFMKDNSRSPLIASDDVLNVGSKPQKGDRLNRRNIYHCDGAKYMSYFKISKKQHQLVKNMKQSGKSIQSRSLNRVLGDLDSLHVQPYEVFVEEEQKKLHEHWLQLANEDIPAFYASWEERKLQIWEVTKSLGQEIKDKRKSLMEDEEEENNAVQDEEEVNQAVQDEGEEDHGFQVEEEEDHGFQEEEEENHCFQDKEEENHGVQDEEKDNSECSSQGHTDSGATNDESDIEDGEDSVPGSPKNQCAQRFTSPNGSREYNLMIMDPESNRVTSKSDDSSSDLSGHLGKMNTADDTVNLEVPLSSGEDVWPAVSRPHSYYNSTLSHEFITGGLPAVHPLVNRDQHTHLMDPQVNRDQQTHLMDPQVNRDRQTHLMDPQVNRDQQTHLINPQVNRDRQTHLMDPQANRDQQSHLMDPQANRDRHTHLMDPQVNRDPQTHLINPQVNQDRQTLLIDLESDLHEEDMGKDLLHRQSDDGSVSAYQNQDRNELLQSLFKSQGMLSYHHEQKQTGLDFQPQNIGLMAGNGQFPGHFQEQLQTSLPLEQGQKRMNEVFMHQNLSENIYTDRGRYLIPRQENLQPANMQNWSVNPVRMSEPLQSHLNGGELLSHNWFTGEHQVRGGWTRADAINIPSQGIGNVSSNADHSLFGVISNCNQLRSVSPFDSIGPTEQQFISPRNYGLMAGVGVPPGISNVLPHTVHHPLDYLGGRDAATSMMPDDLSWMNLSHQNPALHDPMGKPPYLRSWHQ